MIIKEIIQCDRHCDIKDCGFKVSDFGSDYGMMSEDDEHEVFESKAYGSCRNKYAL